MSSWLPGGRSTPSHAQRATWMIVKRPPSGFAGLLKQSSSTGTMSESYTGQEISCSYARREWTVTAAAETNASRAACAS